MPGRSASTGHGALPLRYPELSSGLDGPDPGQRRIRSTRVHHLWLQFLHVLGIGDPAGRWYACVVILLKAWETRRQRG